MSDVPKQLGKYQIRRAIGKGAMGIVYEGFDPVIDRIVAIKTIKKDELDAEEAEEHSRRFLIEAKAAGRLNHKNIVGIYDYGEEKGLSFIVMEFVQGKELKSFFAARHPFSMSQIVRLMSELLDALGYSHSRGVVHRDVKPDNIFVTDDGSVKLGDFGIARIDSTSKTHAGTVLGTPSYMSPEQIRGETADARSDLYAAGVILYQFLVGERPFSGGMVAVMQKVLMEAPRPPSTHNPSIPEAIDTVVMKALAKAAADRFASAAEFSRELSAAVGLSDTEDESESTMIMSTSTLKAMQDGTHPADRTGTGASGTHTGTGTGTGTGVTGGTGPTGRSAGGRSAAIEEAKRRAEEAKRRYEEDLKRAEVELQEAEEEQRTAEVEAQAQAAQWLEESQALLAESATLRDSAQALFTKNTLLVDGPDNASAGRACAAKLRERAAGIGAFVTASYALSPATQAELEARQGEVSAAAAALEPLTERIEREGKAALSGFVQKLEVLEKRLAGQDGAWGVESLALKALDPAAGEEPIAPILARLDKLAASIDQVGKGFASVKAQPLKLPAPQAERLAVIEAQLEAQAAHVARLRTEANAAQARAAAAAEARRVAEEQARKAAEAEAQRRKVEEAARLKAEAESAAEKKRLAQEKARRDAEEAARVAAEAAAAEARRVAEETARKEAEAAAKAKADAEAAAQRQRLAEEKARGDAERQAAEAAKKEADRVAAAENKRLADEEAARLARAKAEQAAETARRKAEDDARSKSEAAAREKAVFESRRQADEEASRQAEFKARSARDLAALVNTAPDATMAGRVSALVEDEAETTVVRPVPDPPQPGPRRPIAAEVPAAPAPAPADGRKKSLLVPIAGVAVVAIAAGAWFALRPAPTVDTATPPVVASASASTPAPVAAPASVPESPPSAVAPVPVPASAPAATSTASGDDAAKANPVDDAAARQRKADADAKAKADQETRARVKAEAEAILNDAAKGRGDADPKVIADASDAKARPDAKARVDADPALAAPARPKAADARSEAADTFRKGYEAYLAGRVPEGIRMMERADTMGAPGARARLCAIYRKPTAAEGKDFLKEANKCKGVD